MDWLLSNLASIFFKKTPYIYNNCFDKRGVANLLNYLSSFSLELSVLIVLEKNSRPVFRRQSVDLQDKSNVCSSDERICWPALRSEKTSAPFWMLLSKPMEAWFDNLGLDQMDFKNPELLNGNESVQLCLSSFLLSLQGRSVLMLTLEIQTFKIKKAWKEMKMWIVCKTGMLSMALGTRWETVYLYLSISQEGKKQCGNIQWSAMLWFFF